MVAVLLVTLRLCSIPLLCVVTFGYGDSVDRGVIFSHKNLFNCAFGGREIINIVFEVPRDQGVWGDTCMKFSLYLLYNLLYTCTALIKMYVIRIIGA